MLMLGTLNNPLSSQNTAAIIDGKKIAEAVREEVRVEVERMKAGDGARPGAGSSPCRGAQGLADVRAQQEEGLRGGRDCELRDPLPADATEEEVLQKVQEVNNDPRVHGVLVQPAPAQGMFRFCPHSTGAASAGVYVCTECLCNSPCPRYITCQVCILTLH